MNASINIIAVASLETKAELLMARSQMKFKKEKKVTKNEKPSQKPNQHPK